MFEIKNAFWEERTQNVPGVRLHPAYGNETTSNFTKDASKYVLYIESKIILVDEQRLAELMVENNVGVSSIGSYEIKKIDSDFF